MKGKEVQVIMDKRQQQEILNKFTKFSKTIKFQKSILSILVGVKADKDDLKEMKTLFQQMDKNNDGTLTLDEIKAANKKRFNFGDKWEAVMQKIDLDGNGKIDFHEFFVAVANHQKYVTIENLK